MATVAVLGASNDPERYAFKAMKMLGEYGHEAIPVHPRESEVLGHKVWPNLTALAETGPAIDTLTVYVGPKLSDALEKDFLRLKPRRVIFNPGSENPRLQKLLIEQGVVVEEACTLVLLRTGQFSV